MRISQPSSIHAQFRFTLDAPGFETVTIAAFNLDVGLCKLRHAELRIAGAGDKCHRSNTGVAVCNSPKPVTLDSTRIRAIVV